MSGVKKYRKKPVVVEAIQWTGENVDEIAAFTCGNASFRTEKDDDVIDLIVRTLEGVMYARHTDYIVKGVDGEFYPCRADIFKQTYEPVDEAAFYDKLP